MAQYVMAIETWKPMKRVVTNEATDDRNARYETLITDIAMTEISQNVRPGIVDQKVDRPSTIMRRASK